MDQSTIPQASERHRAVGELSRFVAAAVDAARVKQEPFFHLEFDRVFPDDIYRAMLDAMPRTTVIPPQQPEGRHPAGRHRDARQDRPVPGIHPRSCRPSSGGFGTWSARRCARARCSDAFVRKLAPALARRFGPEYARVGLYPIPTLTRDGPGYTINIHSDHLSKGITVQLYLPRDSRRRTSAPSFTADCRTAAPAVGKKFAPNTGYAFAVDRDTRHSVDNVGAEVKTRDSILLTYYRRCRTAAIPAQPRQADRQFPAATKCAAGSCG